MSTLKKVTKKAFTVGVVASTIVWSVGVFGFAGIAAAAYTPTAGDKIKIATNPAVYYIGSDLKRHLFSTLSTYESWYGVSTAKGYWAAQSIKTISQSEFDAITNGARVTVRPGSVLKFENSSKYYAVADSGKLAELADDATAKTLYGTAYKTNAKVITASFEADYDPSLAVINASNPNYPTGVTAPASGTANPTFAADSSTITGSVSFALAAGNPASTNIAKNAVRVEFTRFTVSGSGTISNLVAKRVGPGNVSDFGNVYLYEGDVRLTTGRSVNSSTHEVNFTGLNLAVNGTRTLSIVADMAASSSGGVHAFEVLSASGVNSTGLPVVGNQMSISNVTVGGITISKTGSLTDPKIGEQNIKVAEFKLDASSVEDLQVKSIALYQAGNISRSNISNFVLKQGGSVVATAAALDNNDRVTLTFSSPFAIQKGNSRSFELYANIGASARVDDTVRFYLENAADLYATGSVYGSGVGVTYSAYDNGSNDGSDASWTTVDGGQVTLSFQGPATSDFAVDSQDVVLTSFNITSQNNVEFRHTRFVITAAGDDSDNDATDNGGLITQDDSANYTDIKFVDAATGAVIAGPVDVSTSGSDTAQTFDLTDTWTMNAGESKKINVTADIANFTPASNEKVYVSINPFQANDIKNLDNNLYVATTDVVPSSAIVGNSHNVLSGGLTLSLASTPNAQNYVNGSYNLPMTGINFKAGTGKDVYVKSIKLTVTGANSCATETDCVLTTALYDGTTQIGATKSLSATTVTFDSLNVKIDKGTTKTITVKTNLNTLGTVAASTSLHFDVAATSDVTAQDVNGNTVTVTGTVTGPTQAIVSGGSLTAAKASDDTETETGLVVAGQSGVTLAKYRFTAQYEDLKISKMKIKLNTVDNYKAIKSLALYDGSTAVSSAASMSSDGAVSFTDVNFTIPKDSSKTLTVKADLNSISDGAVSGSDLKVVFDYDTDFEARGTNSSTVKTSVGSADIAGNIKILRKTKPTISLVSLDSTLNNGSAQTLYKFTVAADQAEDVAVRQLKFNVVVTDNVGTDNTLAVGSWKLLRNGVDITDQVMIAKADGTTIESTNTVGEGSTTIVVTFGGTGLNGEELIAKGTQNTYELRATPTGFTTGADDDSVNIELANDSSAQTAGYTYIDDTDATASEVVIGLSDGTTNNEAQNIIWSDNSAIPHSAQVTDGGAATDVSSADWINGYLVKNMPIGAQTKNN